MRRTLLQGVDGIITNYPARLTETVRSFQKTMRAQTAKRISSSGLEKHLQRPACKCLVWYELPVTETSDRPSTIKEMYDRKHCGTFFVRQVSSPSGERAAQASMWTIEFGNIATLARSGIPMRTLTGTSFRPTRTGAFARLVLRIGGWVGGMSAVKWLPHCRGKRGRRISRSRANEPTRHCCRSWWRRPICGL